MSAELPRWMYGDPADVCERLEIGEQRRYERSPEGRAARARQELAAQFEGGEMGRKISIPGNILNGMYDWGAWARRPQFWVNLGSTPFYRLLPIPQPSRPIPEVRLDPLAHHIHKAVMRMESDLTRAMLYVYFVREASYEDHATLFTERGISYVRFIDMVKVGSHEAYQRGKRTLEAQQKIYKSISM